MACSRKHNSPELAKLLGRLDNQEWHDTYTFTSVKMLLKDRILSIFPQRNQGHGVIFLNSRVVPILIMCFSEILVCKLNVLPWLLSRMEQSSLAVVCCILERLLLNWTATRGGEVHSKGFYFSIVCPFLEKRLDLFLESLVQSDVHLAFTEHENILSSRLVIQE